MNLDNHTDLIQWCLHLKTAPDEVFIHLSTRAGRELFWAESAPERDGVIHFQFPNGEIWQGKIIEVVPEKRFVIQYYGGSLASFELSGDGEGGTILRLRDEGVPPDHYCEVKAGWVSVLLNLKAAADYGVDLRNHHPSYTWKDGFVGN
jgi:uncharacterized protein YndB with AHSA1/START domain